MDLFQQLRELHGVRRGVILWTALVGALTTAVAVSAFRDEPNLLPPEPSAAADVAASEAAFILPHDPPELPPGPHRQLVVSSCTICHSLRLITNQPPFPRKKWAEEVHRMVTAYGAPLAPEEESHIVEYLMVLRGRQE